MSGWDQNRPHEDFAAWRQAAPDPAPIAEYVWVVIRDDWGLDSVWATAEDAHKQAEILADHLAERGVDVMAERYELRHFDGSERGTDG